MSAIQDNAAKEIEAQRKRAWEASCGKVTENIIYGRGGFSPKKSRVIQFIQENEWLDVVMDGVGFVTKVMIGVLAAVVTIIEVTWLVKYTWTHL
jgi:hypothetical protein